MGNLKRKEALDIRVINMATLIILNANLNKIAGKMEKPSGDKPVKPVVKNLPPEKKEKPVITAQTNSKTVKVRMLKGAGGPNGTTLEVDKEYTLDYYLAMDLISRGRVVPTRSKMC